MAEMCRRRSWRLTKSLQVELDSFLLSQLYGFGFRPRRTRHLRLYLQKRTHQTFFPNMMRIQINRFAFLLLVFLLLLRSIMSDVLAQSSNDCCQNGGVCMLKSFCVCSPKFYGRHCEFKLLERSCSQQIKHGTWLRSDCDLCWCFDGTFRCQFQVFRGCSNSRTNYLLETDDILDAKREIYIYPSLPNGDGGSLYFTGSNFSISFAIVAVIGLFLKNFTLT